MLFQAFLMSTNKIWKALCKNLSLGICRQEKPKSACTSRKSGPSCSKLKMSLVNDSLKFTSSDTQICWNFFQQKISQYCILNLLKQLTKWPLTGSLSLWCFEQLGPDQCFSLSANRIFGYYRMYGEKRSRWYFVHTKENLNLNILCMFKGISVCFFCLMRPIYFCGEIRKISIHFGWKNIPLSACMPQAMFWCENYKNYPTLTLQLSP